VPGIDLGETVALSWTSAAAGTAVLTLRAPDGTVSTPTVTGVTTVHTASFTANQAGRWLASWIITGGDSYTDIVDVWQADPRFLISLDDARSALNLTTTNTISDADLRLYIAAATPVIEDIAGPILSSTATATGDACKASVLLGSPANTITSVTVDGVAFTAYTVDLVAGVVTATAGSFGGTKVTVTYTLGSSIIPPNIRLATREEVRFLVQIGKQGARPTTPAMESGSSWTPSGFAVPKRVIELCSPNDRVWGFA